MKKDELKVLFKDKNNKRIKKNHYKIYLQYKEEIDKLFPNVSTDLHLEKVYLLFNNLEEPPKCPICNENRKFQGKFYYDTCCKKDCIFKLKSTILKELYQNRSEEEKQQTIEKRKETNNIVYGGNSSMSLLEIREKVSNSHQNRSEEEKQQTIKKRKETNLDLYNVEFPLQYKEFSDKQKNSLNEKSDEEWIEIINKRNITNYLKTDEEKQLTKDRRKETFLIKYGVENPSQLFDVHIKQQKRAGKK